MLRNHRERGDAQTVLHVAQAQVGPLSLGSQIQIRVIGSHRMLQNRELGRNDFVLVRSENRHVRQKRSRLGRRTL